jgi:hypothetical protein
MSLGISHWQVTIGGPSANKDQHIDPNTLRVVSLLPKKRVAQIKISTDVQFGFQ